jgi:hypothetical protein
MECFALNSARKADIPYLKLISAAFVREQTIPTELLPLFGEVSAYFCRCRVSRGQRNGSPRLFFRSYRPAILPNTTVIFNWASKFMIHKILYTVINIVL